MANAQILVLFRSVHQVMKAERMAKSEGLVFRIIPVPKRISSECGMCLSTDQETAEKAQQLFNEQGLQCEILPHPGR